MIEYYSVDDMASMACVWDSDDFLDFCGQLDYNSVEEMPQAMKSYQRGTECLDIFKSIVRDVEQIDYLICDVLDNSIGVFVDTDRKIFAVDLFNLMP